MNCKVCGNEREPAGDCSHCGAPPMPEDYETCGECGFDHDYEYVEAYRWHEEEEKRRVRHGTSIDSGSSLQS